MRKVIDEQLIHNDCGISVVKTIFNIFRTPIQRAFIKANIDVSDKGSTLRSLVTFINENGLDAKYKLLDFEDSTANITYIKSLLPFILQVKSKNELHYVVIDQIRDKKFRVLDPSRAFPYFLTTEALNAIAYKSANQIKLVDIEEKIHFLIKKELLAFDVDLKDALNSSDIATLYNKINYFSYIKDKYGFKDFSSAKGFLNDLIFQQELSTLPKGFKSLRIQDDKVQIQSSLVIAVKKGSSNGQAVMDSESQTENIYLKLFYSLGRNKKLWYIYIISALFAATTTQLSVFINQILIDNILPSFQLNILIIFSIGVGIFKIFELVINQYKSFIAIHLGNILDHHFLSKFDEKLNDLSISYIQSFKRGDLLERLSDSLRLKRFFVQFFTQIMVDVVVALYSLIILFFIDWQLALIACAVFVLFIFWFKIITPYLKSNERLRFMKKAELFSTIIEKIDGLQVIKSFRIEHVVSNKINRTIDNFIRIQTKVQYINLINTTVVSVIVVTATMLIIVLLAKKSILFQYSTIGQIITFILISNRIFSTLSSLLRENLSLQEHEVILHRFLDFENAKRESIQQNSIHSFSIEKLQIDNLSFGYSIENPILKNIQLEISKNDRIRIVGKNGSGKSTLAKLISLLYEPNSGDYSINDTSYKFYHKDSLRSKILLISNEDILFNDTIEFNITLGKSVSASKIIEYTKMVDFYDTLTKNEEGLNYIISESGKNLSTGQRKKILILRALVSDAEIIIMDEVLSGLDQEVRAKIELVLNSTPKTLIIVSHEEINNIVFTQKYLVENGRLSTI